MPVLDLRGNGHHIAGLQASGRLALLLIPALAVYADQQLTAAGQIIYRYAQRFFVESEHAILEAEQAEARQNATLSIGSSLLDRCQFLPLGSYQHCVAVSREHSLPQNLLSGENFHTI